MLAVFIFSSIFSLSLGVTVNCLLSSLQQKRLLTVSLITNFVLVPLIALALSSVIPLGGAAVSGLLIYSLLCGAEGGPKFVQMADGNSIFSLGLLMIFLMYSVCVVPFILPLFIDGASFNVGAIVVKLSFVVVLPLFLGVFINSKSAAIAKRLHDVSHQTSVLTLFAVFFALIYINFEAVAGLSINELFAGLMFFVLVFVLGYALGGPEIENRRALAMMSFARNGSVAMLIASSVFGADSKELVFVTLMSVSSVILGVAIVALLKAFSTDGRDSDTV